MNDALKNQYRSWIEAHCSAVDELYLELQPFFEKEFHRLSYFHFSSKRNDLFPTLTRLIRMQKGAASETAWLSDWNSAFSTKSIVLRAWRSFRIFAKLQLFLVWIRFYRRSAKLSELFRAKNFFLTVATERDAEKLNRQYGDVFDALSEREACTYIATFFSDGFHVSSSLQSMISMAKRYFDSKRPVVALEEVMPLWFPLAGMIDVLRISFSSFRLGAQSSQISPRLRAAFSGEIEMTLLRIAHYRMTERFGRVLSRSIQNKRLIYILFEQNYGKALFSSLRSTNRLVGVQHGTYSFLRMGQYLSKQEMKEGGYPHVVIAEGENHAQALRLHDRHLDVQVLGAPRFSRIRTREAKSPGQMRGWVMLGLHQYEHLLEFVSKACGDSSGDSVHWVVRPHPIDSKAPREIERLLAKELEAGRVSVSTGPVNWGQAQVDFSLFDDSSIGIELFASGVPAYFVRSKEREEILCPLHDCEVFGRSTAKFEVHSIQDLVAALARSSAEHNDRVDGAFFFANAESPVSAWVEYLSRS